MDSTSSTPSSPTAAVASTEAISPPAPVPVAVVAAPQTPGSDPRRIVGGRVYAKACCVVNNNRDEFLRYYPSCSNPTQLVPGRIVSVEDKVLYSSSSSSLTTTSPSSLSSSPEGGGGGGKKVVMTYVTADFELGGTGGGTTTTGDCGNGANMGTIKRCRLNIRSIKPSQGLPRLEEHDDDTEGRGPVIVETQSLSWYQDDRTSRMPINGPVPPLKQWGIKTPSGRILSAGSDSFERSLSRLDYFLLLYPPIQLQEENRLVNIQLSKYGKSPSTTIGEILKFKGILLLATRFDFRKISDLWSSTTSLHASKYIPAPNFGSTGMTRVRFIDLCQAYHQQWSSHRTNAGGGGGGGVATATAAGGVAGGGGGEDDDPSKEKDSSGKNQHPPNSSTNNKIRSTHTDTVVEFVLDRFNQHRSQIMMPSDRICVDETRIFNEPDDRCATDHNYYNYTEHRKNDGDGMHPLHDSSSSLARYKLQNAACGRSGIMLQIRLASPHEEEHGDDEPSALGNSNDDEVIGMDLDIDGEDEFLHSHGSAMSLNSLVQPWAMTDRIVCAGRNSRFVSVQSARVLLQMLGLKLVGCMKKRDTEKHHYQKDFPMAYLSSSQLGLLEGDTKGLISTITGTVFTDEDGSTSASPATIMALAWMDWRDRRYLISTVGSLEDAKQPYGRFRWRLPSSAEVLDSHHNPRQETSPGSNAEPDQVQLTIPQPVAFEIYFSASQKVRDHNRYRLEALKLESKHREIHSNDTGSSDDHWTSLINYTMFGINCVDSWLAFSQCTTADETQHEFYSKLAEELIDNRYDVVGPGPLLRCSTGAQSLPSGTYRKQPRSGIHAHLTLTKRKRKNRVGDELNYSLQGRCGVCSTRTIKVCSQCKEDDPDGKEPYICDSKNGKTCFVTHLQDKHGIVVPPPRNQPEETDTVGIADVAPRAGIGPHLATTKRRRKNKDGVPLPFSLQGRCLVCKVRTIQICSQCKQENPEGREPYICDTKKGKMCFSTHLREKHGI